MKGNFAFIHIFFQFNYNYSIYTSKWGEDSGRKIDWWGRTTFKRRVWFSICLVTWHFEAVLGELEGRSLVWTKLTYKHWILFSLSFDGCLKLLVLMGGGGWIESISPISICENNRKSNKIMHCVFLSGSLKTYAFFTYFIYLYVMGRYKPLPHQN